LKNVSSKSCTENQDFYVPKRFPENRAVYEITPKNAVEPDRSQMTIWRMLDK
jgi:hypothetical protein